MVDSELDKTTRKNEILRTAQEVFAKYGYRKATVEEIAEKLGVVKSAIYYYYRNKQDLFMAVLEHEAVHFFENIRGLLDPDATVEDKLLVYARQMIRHHQDFINFYNLTMDEIFQNYEGLVRVRNTFLDRNMALVAEILKSGGPAGFDIKQSSRIFLFTLGGIFHNYLLEKKPVPDAVLTSFVSIFYGGLYR